MLTEDLRRNLVEQLINITKYSSTNLVSRPGDWGSIDFESAKSDIDLALSIGRDLSDLPVEFLTESAANQLVNQIPGVAHWLRAIDEFSILGRGDPGSNREEICAGLHQETERLQEIAGPSIPYLAFRRGDITENLSKLEATLDNAKKTLAESEAWIAEKQKDVEETVSATRDAAASVGVATFTQEFDQEAESLNKRSWLWLFTSAGFGVVTVIAAVGSFFWPTVSLEAGAWETLRNAVSKVAVIAILFTITVWCGRIYRALVHQATVNRHRALSLRTFRAFVEATENEYVRDAVLMAATKAVFGTVPTGLVEQKSSSNEPAVNFVEFGRSAIKNTSSAQAD